MKQNNTQLKSKVLGCKKKEKVKHMNSVIELRFGGNWLSWCSHLLLEITTIIEVHRGQIVAQPV